MSDIVQISFNINRDIFSSLRFTDVNNFLQNARIGGVAIQDVISKSTIISYWSTGIPWMAWILRNFWIRCIMKIGQSSIMAEHIFLTAAVFARRVKKKHFFSGNLLDQRTRKWRSHLLRWRCNHARMYNPISSNKAFRWKNISGGRKRYDRNRLVTRNCPLYRLINTRAQTMSDIRVMSHRGISFGQ